MSEAKVIKDFLTLMSDVVVVDINLKPKINEDGSESPVQIKAYLKSLTYNETLHVRQLALDQRAWAEEKGLPEKVGADTSLEAIVRGTIFYAVRSGYENTAPRLFQDEREVMRLPAKSAYDIYNKYAETFNLSDEDLGESLRARISRT